VDLPFLGTSLGAIPSILSKTLKTYKVYILIALFLGYTYGVYHITSQVKEAGYLKEKVELQAKVKELEDHRKAISDAVEKKIDEKLGNMQTTQKTINQKVIREIIEKPVYSECIVPDTGVQLIEDTIRNQGQSSN
jgi:hypothetical protein